MMPMPRRCASSGLSMRTGRPSSEITPSSALVEPAMTRASVLLPATFSTMPDHQVYRPVTMVTLAVDYWLGRGLKPFWFHLSTFAWLIVQTILMFFLFRRIMDAAQPHPSNQWTAWFAAALYGLHP